MSNHVYFVSDIHLGVPDRQSSLKREKKLVRWLEMVGQHATEIIILGDLFDFWFEYRQVVPKGYVRLLGKLAELSDKGVQIHMFRGNHDMWMFNYLQEEMGVKMYSDEWETHWDGKRFFIHHGDGLGPGDRTYKLLRKIFRNKLAQELFRWIHPDFGMRVANYFSKRSRLANESREEVFDEPNEWLLQFCKMKEAKEHFDFYIFGHRHLALDIPFAERSRYLNLGEWVSDNHYAYWNGKELKLLQYE